MKLVTRESYLVKRYPFRRVILLALLASLFTLHAYASGPGTTTGELLKIPIGTRAIGMGEAYTALADDASSLYWNPAGLAILQQKEASFMHSSLIENIHYEHMAYASPGESYSLGGAFSYLGYGDIAGYDNTGAPTGNLSAYSYIATAGLAREVMPALTLGMTGSFLRQVLDADSAGTFAANMGALYRLSAHPWKGTYTLGTAVQNVGPGLKFVSERDPLPRKIKFGVAGTGLGGWPLTLTADVTTPNDNSTYISFGSEYTLFQNLFAMRFGYDGSNDQGKGLRMGFGLNYSDLLFDYAYGGFGDFGATHRVSISLRFGHPTKQLNSLERTILKEAKAAGQRGDYLQSILHYNRILEIDPSNEDILKKMVAAYDQMAKKSPELAVAAQPAAPPILQTIPTDEQAALNALLPQTAYGPKAAPAPPKSNEFDPKDPLNLEKLPDASNPESIASYLSKDRENGMTAALSPTPAVPATSMAPGAAAMPLGQTGAPSPKTSPSFSPTPVGSNSQDTPALSPSDIYGN